MDFPDELSAERKPPDGPFDHCPVLCAHCEETYTVHTLIDKAKQEFYFIGCTNCRRGNFYPVPEENRVCPIEP